MCVPIKLNFLFCKRCCRILHGVRENLCGVLVRQSIGQYLSDFLRLFAIATISELFGLFLPFMVANLRFQLSC